MNTNDFWLIQRLGNKRVVVTALPDSAALRRTH